jgi:uncharacterized protein YndB with AHSA1/START domain
MPDIHHSIVINASPEAVHSLVSTADGLRQWWAEDVEPQADGTLSLGFFNRNTIYRLRSLERSATRIAWRCETGKEWEGTDLVFTIQLQAKGVVLDFVHANWQAATPYFVSCTTTWGGLMFRIRSAAEGHGAGPLFAKNSLAY